MNKQMVIACKYRAYNRKERSNKEMIHLLLSEGRSMKLEEDTRTVTEKARKSPEKYASNRRRKLNVK